MNDYFLNSKKITCIDTGETVIGYANYLKSKHWKILRSQLIKDGVVCSHCSEKSKLQLHHLHYNTLGNEKASDFCVLCDTCHKLFHAGMYKPHRVSKSKNKNTKSVPKTCANCHYSSELKLKRAKASHIKTIQCNLSSEISPEKICNKYRPKRNKKVNVFYGHSTK